MENIYTAPAVKYEVHTVTYLPSSLRPKLLVSLVRYQKALPLPLTIEPIDVVVPVSYLEPDTTQGPYQCNQSCLCRVIGIYHSALSHRCCYRLGEPRTSTLAWEKRTAQRLRVSMAQFGCRALRDTARGPLILHYVCLSHGQATAKHW
jgi:hypothetical protein